MADFGGQNYTSFSGVNIKGSIALRAEGQGAAGTLKVDLSEGVDRAWTLPNKSGTIPITGTFTVNLPAISASSFGETAVTITGIRKEDAFVVSILNLGYTTVTATTKTYPFIAGARPENGYAYLTFYNPTTTATVYSDMVIAYTAAR